MIYSEHAWRMTIATLQMASRYQSMADKILPIPATEMSDLFVDNFLKNPRYVKQKPVRQIYLFSTSEYRDI